MSILQDFQNATFDHWNPQQGSCCATFSNGAAFHIQRDPTVYAVYGQSPAFSYSRFLQESSPQLHMKIHRLFTISRLKKHNTAHTLETFQAQFLERLELHFPANTPQFLEFLERLLRSAVLMHAERQPLNMAHHRVLTPWDQWSVCLDAKQDALHALGYLLAPAKSPLVKKLKLLRVTHKHDGTLESPKSFVLPSVTPTAHMQLALRDHEALRQEAQSFGIDVRDILPPV